MSLFKTYDPDLLNARNAVLADNWWAVALRGVLAILFGIAAFALPAATMLALVIFFAAYSLLDGILSIILAVRGARKGERWGLLALNGVWGIAVSIAAMLWPGLTVLAFVLMVAAWSLITGGLMLGAAFSLKVSHGRWLLVLGSLLSLIWGVLLVISPFVGALVLTWWIGAQALVFGVILIMLAFRLRQHRGEHMPTAMAAPG